MYRRSSSSSSSSIRARKADPLALLMVDHFRTPGAELEALEPVRAKLLPDSTVDLQRVLDDWRFVFSEEHALAAFAVAKLLPERRRFAAVAATVLLLIHVCMR